MFDDSVPVLIGFLLVFSRNCRQWPANLLSRISKFLAAIHCIAINSFGHLYSATSMNLFTGAPDSNVHKSVEFDEEIFR